ncbi:MAG: TIGR01666 family membrane protein [Aquabacterium sp.]|nr:MAG: TIGR01666 family membrane protein [Aquabacterium sp.]
MLTILAGAVPGRLQQVDENWKDGWRTLLQHEGAMNGLRALLALACVLAVGWWAGRQDELMPVLLGVIASALTETDDNWRGRLRAQLMALGAFVMMAWAVWLTLPWPILLMTVLALSAFGLTMLGALSERYRAIAFGSLVLFIYVAMSARTSRLHALDVTPLMLAGAAWYGLVSVLWAALLPQPPVRHRLSQLYALLGEYLHLKAQLLEPVRDADRAQRRMALALHNGRVVESLGGTKEAIFSRLGKRRPPPWLQTAMRQYLAAQDIHERASSSHEHYELLADAFFHSDALYRCQRVLALTGDQALKLSVAMAQRRSPEHHGATARAIEDMQAAIAHLSHGQAASRSLRALQALGDNLTALAQVFRTVLEPGQGEVDQSLLDTHPRTLGEAWRRLRAQLSLRSVLCRHALRLSVSLMVGCGVMWLTDDPHGFWILLTIVFVSQPQYAATLTKLTQRVMGTVIGLALAWALIRLFPGAVMQSALLVVAGAVFLGSRRTNYVVSTSAVTTLLLLSFHQMGMAQGVIPARLLDTVLGGAIAAVAAWRVWPNWQARQWPHLAAQALRTQARYLHDILLQYQTGKQDHLAYRLARRNAHKADAALSNALSAMLKEPVRVRLDTAVCGRFLTLSHTVLNYLSALGAHRSEVSLQACSEPVLAQADRLQAALGILADALEAREASPPAAASVLRHTDLSDADSEAGLAALSRTERLLHTQLTLALRLVPPLQAEVWRLKGWAPALSASAPSGAASPTR